MVAIESWIVFVYEYMLINLQTYTQKKKSEFELRVEIFCTMTEILKLTTWERSKPTDTWMHKIVGEMPISDLDPYV